MKTLLFGILLSLLLSVCGCGGSSSSSGNGSSDPDPTPSLSGKYFAIHFMDDEVNTGGYIIASTFAMTFSDTGSAGFQTDSHSLNQITSGNFTYTIQSDGRLTTSDNHSGIVSSNGSIFTLADTDATDDALQVMVGLKASSGMQTSDLTGEFICATIADDGVNTGGHVRSVIGQAYFDGAGNCILATLSSSDGYINSTQYGTYSVQSDGRIIFPGSDLFGFVSGDGNTILLADTTASDDDIGVGIGLKKSSGMSSADVLGDYLGVYAMDRTPTGDTTKTALIAYLCDGSDPISYQEQVVSDGQLDVGTHTLGISSDGCLNGHAGITGIVSADGEIIIQGDAHSVLDVIAIEIAIRKSE